ncbi:hypothetical protein ABLV49_09780 [Polaromonas hydrogenivorans]|uniref:Uncharacterized protein n=1 Tax=Polaromonas hydrogenivorans TaxID=335476 RepID=A0AAU7LWV8_9BURK
MFSSGWFQSALKFERPVITKKVLENAPFIRDARFYTPALAAPQSAAAHVGYKPSCPFNHQT